MTTKPQRMWLVQAFAFAWRDYELARTDWSWLVGFSIHSAVNTAAVALVGVSLGDAVLTRRLAAGMLTWSYISSVFGHIAMSLSYERVDGSFETTLANPAPRSAHLAGVGFFALCYGSVRAVILSFVVNALIGSTFSPADFVRTGFVVALSSSAFVGLGVMAAALPLLSPRRGGEATTLVQSALLLLSGVYYAVSILPTGLRHLSYISPVTYTLRAVRKSLGCNLLGDGSESAIADAALAGLAGLLLLPLALAVFALAEARAKRLGLLRPT